MPTITFNNYHFIIPGTEVDAWIRCYVVLHFFRDKYGIIHAIFIQDMNKQLDLNEWINNKDYHYHNKIHEYNKKV